MNSRFLTLSLSVVSLFAFGGICDAADHMEAPGVLGDPDLDINDLFIFQSPTDSTKAVLALTVNPFTGPNATFRDRGGLSISN